VTVVFTIPDGVPSGWEQGDLWNSATTIPGLRVIRDQGGQEAHRFEVAGSDTSCCMPLAASCFSAEGHRIPLDTKGTTKATLLS
jgi:hypothetical protein